MDYSEDNLNLDDIEIPEDNKIDYEIWVIGYDSKNKLTDVEKFLGAFTDRNKAIEFAKSFTLLEILKKLMDDESCLDNVKNLASLSVEVEIVVETEDHTALNAGTIFTIDFQITEDDFIKLEKEDIQLTKNDYTTLEDGILKIKCDLLKGYNTNDYVTILFIDEIESFLFTYKIKYKAAYDDSDYYFCEFAY